MERALEPRCAQAFSEPERPPEGRGRGLPEVAFGAKRATQQVPQPSESDAYGGPTRF